MANLQGLKIPRGNRGDWPALEYQLIDYVEAVITEVENAREGQSTLLANLVDRYATKSYVQIAVGNPTPGDILVTDLSVSPSDALKLGYSLQISPSGTLQFLDTYKAGNGTLALPGFSFAGNAAAGMGYSESGDTREIFFSISGNRVGYFHYNSVTGAKSFVMDGASYSVTLTSTGGIELQYVTAPGSSSFGTVSVTKLTATGTGASATTLAEAAVTKLSSTGTGASATTLAEAAVTKLSSTGTGADATTLAEAAVTKLSSTGTAANATTLAELNLTTLNWKYFIQSSITLNPADEAELRAIILDLQDSFISDNADVTVQLPAGGITLTADIDISNIHGANILIRGHSDLVADAIRLNGYDIIVRGTSKVARIYNAYIQKHATLGGSVIVDKACLTLDTPIVLDGNGSATPITFVNVFNGGTVCIGQGPSPETLTVTNAVTLFNLVSGNLVWSARTGVTYGGTFNITGTCQTFIRADSHSNISLTIPEMIINVTASSTTFGIYGGSTMYHAGSVYGHGNSIPIRLHGSEAHIGGSIYWDASGSSGVGAVIAENGRLHVTGSVILTSDLVSDLSSFSLISMTHNSSLHIEEDLLISKYTGATFVSANRFKYGIELRDNSECSVKGDVSISEVVGTACIFTAQGGEFTHNGDTSSFYVGGNATASVTYGVYSTNGSNFSTLAAYPTVAYATTGFMADRMSANFFPTGTIFTSAPTNFSPSPIGTAGNQNALSAYNI